MEFQLEGGSFQGFHFLGSGVRRSQEDGKYGLSLCRLWRFRHLQLFVYILVCLVHGCDWVQTWQRPSIAKIPYFHWSMNLSTVRGVLRRSHVHMSHHINGIICSGVTDVRSQTPGFRMFRNMWQMCHKYKLGKWRASLTAINCCFGCPPATLPKWMVSVRRCTPQKNDTVMYVLFFSKWFSMRATSATSRGTSVPWAAKGRRFPEPDQTPGDGKAGNFQGRMTLLKCPSNGRSVQQRTLGTPPGAVLQLYDVASCFYCHFYVQGRK